MKDQQGAGFTLLELLVVVAIITILASLLALGLSSAIGKGRRAACMNNLRQISLGVRLYSDDSSDRTPRTAPDTRRRFALAVFVDYKALMKSYVGLRSASSARDQLFACPADTFYFDFVLGQYPYSAPKKGYVARRVCARPDFAFSSYVFNAGNLTRTNRSQRTAGPGIAGLPLSAIAHPDRTVLVTEAPALIPFSWHKPKRPLYLASTRLCPNCIFNNAMNMVSFVDGHVSYVKMYWNGVLPEVSCSRSYDPPVGYDYQWSPN